MASFTRSDGVEIDDDPRRVDVGVVHRFLSQESYWARGRDRAVVERLVRDATRVVGAYDEGAQIGFARCFSDRVTFAWVADVYVESSHRRRSIGRDIVEALIERSDFGDIRWMLGTADAHRFYAQFGFTRPSHRLLERPRSAGDPELTSTQTT